MNCRTSRRSVTPLASPTPPDSEIFVILCCRIAAAASAIATGGGWGGTQDRGGARSLVGTPEGPPNLCSSSDSISVALAFLRCHQGVEALPLN
nr:hypothetical protein Iba_chr09aCG16780 [Ipomoea batatas]GMD33059.1 hypothetical protein Iba_chr09bCG14070 [Ipomoea batatas]